MSRPKHKIAKPISALTLVIGARDDFFIVRPTSGGRERDIYFMRGANGDIEITWQHRYAAVISFGSAKQRQALYRRRLEAEIGRAATRQAALLRDGARQWITKNRHPLSARRQAAGTKRFAALLLKSANK